MHHATPKERCGDVGADDRMRNVKVVFRPTQLVHHTVRNAHTPTNTRQKLGKKS